MNYVNSYQTFTITYRNFVIKLIRIGSRDAIGTEKDNLDTKT